MDLLNIKLRLEHGERHITRPNRFLTCRPGEARVRHTQSARFAQFGKALGKHSKLKKSFPEKVCVVYTVWYTLCVPLQIAWVDIQPHTIKKVEADPGRRSSSRPLDTQTCRQCRSGWHIGKQSK